MALPSPARERQMMIVAGEASGDLHAGGLVAELRRRHPGWHFFGCGGPSLRAAGVEILVDAKDVTVVGLVEVLAHLPRIARLHRRLRRALRRRRPAAVILVDFPDFNLPLAKAAARLGIPVIYFISPQVWAWREKRVETIRRAVRRMICIFPFEPAFYARHGIAVEYVGHPLVQAVRPSLSREAFFHRHGLRREAPLIALMPGSRRREIQHNLPPMLAAAAALQSAVGAQFVLPLAPTVGAAWLGAAIPAAQRASIHLLGGGDQGEAHHAYDALAHADLAVVASGTATLEAALLRTPMVVVYRLSKYSYWLGRRWVRTPHFAMVNLIAGRAVVPELIQNDYRPEAVVNWALKLLAGAPGWNQSQNRAGPTDEPRQTMLRGYEEVRRRLQPPASSGRGETSQARPSSPALSDDFLPDFPLRDSPHDSPPVSPWFRAATAVESALETLP